MAFNTARRAAVIPELEASTMASLAIAEGDRVRLTQSGGSAVLVARRDDRLAPGVVQVAAAHPSTAGLPSMFGPISVEKLAAEDSVGAKAELSGQQA